MKRVITPARETLEQHAKLIPEINPSSVIAMLRVLEASSAIQHAIIDVLESEYQLSEGKLCVMIILHQMKAGVAPSKLAELAGVTRATISAMLQRMIRDGLVDSFSDEKDGRGKKVCLTSKGRSFMDEVLPNHYLRITKLMGRLSEGEQQELIILLKKIVST
ncbi:MAG: MarR family winged helix-turn-helix transcriptional regulator [Selenomonadaceae bacterium]